jgi:hypothetical protein
LNTRQNREWMVPTALLALGAITYLVRPTTIAALDVPLVRDAAAQARQALVPVRLALPGPLLGVLPDVLWAAALAWILVRIWRGASSAWLVVGLALAAGWEIGQAFGIVPGTFDAADLVCSTAAYVAVVVLDRVSLHRKGFAPS